MSSEPVTTSDRVFQALRQQILFGELKPGTRLVQRQLAAEFGTSNIPIVESIRRLERDGLLITHPKWGAQVNDWSPDDMEAIFLMRESLEAITCRLFAQRATESEKLALKDLGREYDANVATQNWKASTEADIALHLFIAKCSKSANLYHLAESSCIITATLRNNASRLGIDTDVHEHLLGLGGVHDPLIEALSSGDAPRAEAAGRHHVHNALDKLLASLNSPA
jgi:DNA-binding GntR family transcriptional regulator